MAWEDQVGPQLPSHKITSIFRHTKNRPGEPTQHFGFRLDDVIANGFRSYVEGRYDPRITTYSEFIRDAIVCHLEAVMEAKCLEDSPFGMTVTKLLIDEKLYGMVAEREQDDMFLATLRKELEVAKISGDREKVHQLRAAAYMRSNRSESRSFVDGVASLFPNGD